VVPVSNYDDNVVTLVASHIDSDGDSVELYRVNWPDGHITYTFDVRNDGGVCAIAGLDVAAAQRFAAALILPDHPEVEGACPHEFNDSLFYCDICGIDIKEV
jgi:hypothetical protein